MLERFHHLSLTRKAALIAAGLTILASLVLVLAAHQGSRQLVHNSSGLFADSLAQQLARDASTALVQNDKLSLQALLNELVSSPHILNASIYNVANQPVAEAGDRAEGDSYSASITFQDSIAGYAVLTFDTDKLAAQARGLGWQLMALSALLAGLVFLLASMLARPVSAAISDLHQVASLPPGRRQRVSRIAYPGNDELQHLARAILHPPEDPVVAYPEDAYSLLTVRLVGDEELDPREQHHCIHLLRRQFTTLGKLYEARIEASRCDSFSAVFYDQDNNGESEGSMAFKAVCCAYLLQQWWQRQDLPMTLRCSVVENQRRLQAVDSGLAYQATVDYSLALARQPGVSLSPVLWQLPGINDRVQTVPTDDGDRQLQGLAPPYGDLLDRQLTSLLGNP